MLAIRSDQDRMLEEVDEADNGEPRLGFVQVKKLKVDPFFVNQYLSFQPRTFVQVRESKKGKF